MNEGMEAVLSQRERPVQHLRMRRFGQSVVPIYGMLFAMQCARSMFIVLVSWFALQITGETASVGKVLICWQLLAFTVGPFIGPLLDRFHRRTMFAIGETIHGMGVALLAVIASAHPPGHTPIAVLYSAACFISVGSLLSYPSSQALLQRAAAGPLVRIVSFGIFCAQVGNIVGAALGGLCVVLSGGVATGLTICAVSSFLAVVFASFLKLGEHHICPEHHNRHVQDLVRGLLETVRNPRLKVAGCALLLAYASAHASNALLAGFARYELKLSPDLYGWIAAMYSGGGLIGSVVLAKFSGVASEWVLISVGSILLAAATAAFSTSQTMAEAVLWQGCIGLSFMMVRVGSDVTVLRTVPNRMVGRVRSNIDAGIGLTAILIYLLPSIATDIGARQIFLGLSCVFACGSCGILWMQRDMAAEKARRHHDRVDETHPCAGQEEMEP
jgi:MFS family permease